MKHRRTFLAVALVFAAAFVPAYSWEPYDSIIAVVNDTSIIESEIDGKFNQLLKVRSVPKNRYPYEKSRILDKFIEDALINETAVQEAIVVNDRRVFTQIEEMMKNHFAAKIQDPMKLKSTVEKMISRLEKRIHDETMLEDKELDAQVDGFISFVESQVHLNFKDYFEELRNQIMRDQVMSIAIGVSPPSKEEAMDWFKKNRNKLGDEVWVKHIMIRPSGGSFTAERDAGNKLTEARDKIMAGQSFEKIARQYSQDPESAGKGGDLGWKMLAEMDPYFAGFVNNMNVIGQVSPLFKSSSGYHIVKLMGRRPISYEKVERLIMFKLYNESVYQQFKKWVDKKKKESDIQIYMKNYVQA